MKKILLIINFTEDTVNYQMSVNEKNNKISFS